MGRQNLKFCPGKAAAFLHRAPITLLCVKSQEGGKCLSEMSATFNEVCRPTQKCPKNIVFPCLEKCPRSCRVQACRDRSGSVCAELCSAALAARSDAA